MKKTSRWLKEAIFYEVYPQSFYDSNADGIGDLPGIISKLDYIKSLGCNAVWINPCFFSPFQDAGYDISDYYRIAPRYGTLGDMRRLLRRAHKMGIKIFLDLVAAHTSIEHPWFKASGKSARNKYVNYYIWTEDLIGRDAEGLRIVSGYTSRPGAFLVNYFYSQPALNYGFARPDPDKAWQLPVNHPDIIRVRKEIIKIIRYWLDMGVDGFRVDMAYSLVKNDKDKKETIKLWRRILKLIQKRYPRAIFISEWYSPHQAVAAGFDADFPDRDFHLDLLRAAEKSFFSKVGEGDIQPFLSHLRQYLRYSRDSRYVILSSGTHDFRRISYFLDKREREILFVFLLTAPGIPLIYYGDEIGMRYLKNLPSKEGGYFRTGSRTPMQWTKGKNCGFSLARPKQLYLPVDKQRNRPTVVEQEKDSHSLLNHLRRLIRLRQNTPALHPDGDFILLSAKSQKYPLVYLRAKGNEKILIALNPARRTVRTKFKISGIGTEGNSMMGKGIKLKRKNNTYHLEARGTSYGIFRF